VNLIVCALGDIKFVVCLWCNRIRAIICHGHYSLMIEASIQKRLLLEMSFSWIVITWGRMW